ncbi:ATP-binding cassette domain-containing protein [Patescibacteria group bacterium]|nr:ATP-binding cassette domain-containing protein [Patescibacteria group bacterium]
MIKIKDLTKKYDDLAAVDNISLEIKEGEILGFLGPNGAGKTTTMKILTGFMAPTSGSIDFDGLDIIEDSIAIREKIGYLPENNPLYEDMKVYEYLAFMGRVRGMKRDQLLKRMKVMIELAGLKSVLKQPIMELSKGYRQRVGIAQAMLHDPEILILDEPTSGLDPNQIVEIRSLIKKLGEQKTVVLCSHIMQEVQATCDRVIIISEGKIVGQGTPAELTAGVSGNDAMYVKIKGNEGVILEEVVKLEDVIEITKADKESEDIRGYNLTITAGKDIREELFKLAIDNNWSILESRKEAASLEDVFRKLTKS